MSIWSWVLIVYFDRTELLYQCASWHWQDLQADRLYTVSTVFVRLCTLRCHSRTNSFSLHFWNKTAWLSLQQFAIVTVWVVKAFWPTDSAWCNCCNVGDCVDSKVHIAVNWNSCGVNIWKRSFNCWKWCFELHQATFEYATPKWCCVVLHLIICSHFLVSKIYLSASKSKTFSLCTWKLACAHQIASKCWASQSVHWPRCHSRRRRRHSCFKYSTGSWKRSHIHITTVYTKGHHSIQLNSSTLRNTFSCCYMPGEYPAGVYPEHVLYPAQALHAKAKCDIVGQKWALLGASCCLTLWSSSWQCHCLLGCGVREQMQKSL